jgi:glycosyltransferase involved in cell wall biosynthesis
LRAEESEDEGLRHWGANWVEFEGQRYRPRQALTKELDEYDLVQVVAGGPALALAVGEVRVPKVLQVATNLGAERRAQLHDFPPIKRLTKSLSLRSLGRLEVQALRCVDHVMVENRRMEDWVRSMGQPSVTFAPPGIDTHRFCPSRMWSADRPILAFGRLGDPRKDWETAVRAFERFVDATGLDNRLILAGKGPLSASLESRVRSSSKADRIEVCEDIPSDELPGLLASGSVFLQSSLEEGLGLAGLEAMASGLPVVATRTVGSSEYVNPGENGFLVELGADASEGLAAALAQVLAGGHGATMSAAAVRTCTEEYGEAQAFGRFVELYESLIA